MTAVDSTGTTVCISDGGKVTGTVPEGSTLELIGMGLAMAGVLRRRFQA